MNQLNKVIAAIIVASAETKMKYLVENNPALVKLFMAKLVKETKRHLQSADFVELAIEYITDDLPFADPTGAYTQWIVLRYSKSETMLIEDIPHKIGKALQSYDELKTKVINKSVKIEDFRKDINSFKTLEELEDYLEKFAEKKDVREFSKLESQEAKDLLANKDFEYVFKGSEISAIKLNTFEASAYFSQGTKWCTSERGMFSHYSNVSPLYVVFTKNQRYQLHFDGDDSQFMDERDRSIDLYDLIDEHPQLAKAFPNKSIEFWDNPDVATGKRLLEEYFKRGDGDEADIDVYLEHIYPKVKDNDVFFAKSLVEIATVDAETEHPTLLSEKKFKISNKVLEMALLDSELFKHYGLMSGGGPRRAGAKRAPNTINHFFVFLLVLAEKRPAVSKFLTKVLASKDWAINCPELVPQSNMAGMSNVDNEIPNPDKELSSAEMFSKNPRKAFAVVLASRDLEFQSRHIQAALEWFFKEYSLKNEDKVSSLILNSISHLNDGSLNKVDEDADYEPYSYFVKFLQGFLNTGMLETYLDVVEDDGGTPKSFGLKLNVDALTEAYKFYNSCAANGRKIENPEYLSTFISECFEVRGKTKVLNDLIKVTPPGILTMFGLGVKDFKSYARVLKKYLTPEMNLAEVHSLIAYDLNLDQLSEYTDAKFMKLAAECSKVNPKIAVLLLADPDNLRSVSVADMSAYTPQCLELYEALVSEMKRDSSIKSVLGNLDENLSRILISYNLEDKPTKVFKQLVTFVVTEMPDLVRISIPTKWKQPIMRKLNLLVPNFS